MPYLRNNWLVAAAVLNGLAAALHIAIIFFGAPWYRFFGAGDRMADLAAMGHWYPPFLTSLIALVLAGWALYALSGAGVIRALPLLRTALCFITAVYLLRGVAGIPFLVVVSQQGALFWLWTSVLALAFGIVHLIGLLQIWQRLSHKPPN
jgi:hypothetical protein